jgi:phage FluMu gp28-like protein
MSQPNIKQIIQQQYQMCAKDPVFFMRQYCYIQHPKKGKIKFNLFPFQEDSLTELRDNRYSVILKSRQLGISTLSAGFALWSMLFKEDFNVLVIATTQEVAKNLVTKVRVMHENLPSWLKGTIEADNKLSLKFKNGSQIKAVSSATTGARSEALSLLIIDEAAFIRNIEEIWIASQATLSTGGGAIVLSTPNGVGNWFHQTWADAEAAINGFHTIKLHWTVHPERDQAMARSTNTIIR